MPPGTLQVRIQSVHYETDQIRCFTLVDAEGRTLPEFAPGAHIDVHIDDDLIRQYSICSSADDRSRYRIGVLRQSPGANACEYFFDDVQVGDSLKISEPKNLIKLISGAERYVLIAGGIGIVAILSMVYRLEQEKANYILHYCTRSPQLTAFRGELERLVQNGQLEFHFDGGNPAEGLDIPSVLKAPISGSHLYYCGPAGLMDSAKEASGHWPPDSVHCEHFYPDSLERNATEFDPANSEFSIRMASTDKVFTVPPHKSIVDVLMENGIYVDTSCEEGYCGTCLTRYLGGVPEHRDEILDEEDHEEYVLICCARSKTPELLLDL